MVDEDLPAVALFGLLRTIPDNFGGVTTVALHRATSISQTYDRRIDLLTIAPDLDTATKAQELRDNRMLGDKVRLRNLWEELRQAPDHQLTGMAGTVREPVAGDEELPAARSEGDPERLSEDGRVLQVNRFRGDGSLLATDRHDVRSFGHHGGRRLTLFDRQGRLTAQWNSATGFYQSWLDLVTDRRHAVIISDSKTVGGLLHTYRRDHVTFVQVLHSPHLEDPDGSAYGPISGVKRNLLTHVDNYDVVTTLTATQRTEMLATGIAVDNLVAVSNSFTDKTVTDIEPRTRTRGVIVARLTGVKRLDHALRAVADAGMRDASLDVYGDGPSTNRLTKLVDALGLSGRVRFHGHDPHARERFAEASFTLMTSQSEGQGVTLLESMAAGCIPIAYDIRYGPASIITHGVDGFLVPAGDVEALTGALIHVMTLDTATLQTMRHAAVERVNEYRPEVITRQWAKLLRNAVETKQPVATLTGNATLHGAETLAEDFHLTVVVAGLPDHEPDWACLTWLGRGTNVYGRVRAVVTAREEDCLLETDIPLRRLADVGTDSLLDMFVDIRCAGTPGRLRLATGSTATLPARTANVELYSTAHGNLSIRGHSSDDRSVRRNRRRPIRGLLRRYAGLLNRLRRENRGSRLLRRQDVRAGT